MTVLTHHFDLKNLTIEVKLPRLFGFRVWLGTSLFKLGAAIIGAGVSVEAEKYVAPDTDAA